MRNTYTVLTYPGIPHSNEDVVKELLDLLVEQGWGVDGQLSKDQHLHGGVKIFVLQNLYAAILSPVQLQNTEVVCG